MCMCTCGGMCQHAYTEYTHTQCMCTSCICINIHVPASTSASTLCNTSSRRAISLRHTHTHDNPQQEAAAHGKYRQHMEIWGEYTVGEEQRTGAGERASERACVCVCTGWSIGLRIHVLRAHRRTDMRVCARACPCERKRALSWSICVRRAFTTRMASDGSFPDSAAGARRTNNEYERRIEETGDEGVRDEGGRESVGRGNGAGELAQRTDISLLSQPSHLAYLATLSLNKNDAIEAINCCACLLRPLTQRTRAPTPHRPYKGLLNWV